MKRQIEADPETADKAKRATQGLLYLKSDEVLEKDRLLALFNPLEEMLQFQKSENSKYIESKPKYRDPVKF